MDKKLVLWGAAKHWKSSSPVGSHGYAKEFIKDGWKVAFLSTAITPWHNLFTSDKDIFQERKLINKNDGIWYENNMLWEYVPWSLVHSKWAPVHWLKFNFGRLSNAMKKNSITALPQLVWVDSPEYIALFDYYPDAIHIMRIADKNQYFKGMTKKIIRKQKEYAKQADVLIVTSYALEEEFISEGFDNVIRVPNGVDLDRFSPPKVPEIPQDIINISKPIALYVGMIEEWFDLQLLKQAALMLPDVSFVIIGKIGIDVEEVNDVKNIHFLGPRSPQTIVKYMIQADVGIIPFIRNDFVDAINPVKYYEYIACGLPVVATESKEFNLLNEEVFLAKDSEIFVKCVRQALTATIDYKKKLQKSAQMATWNTRWKTIMDVLQSNNRR